MRGLWALPFVLPATLLGQPGGIPPTGATPGAFLPPGHVVLGEARGYLNGDEHPDVVVVAADRRERLGPAGAPPGPRLLLVLHGTAAGYALAVATTTAVLGRPADPGQRDPFEQITLVRNVIVLSHQGGGRWQWRVSHRFRLGAGEYRLIGRTVTWFVPDHRCPGVDWFRPTVHRDEDRLAGRWTGYRVPADRCVRRDQAGVLPAGLPTLLRDFRIGTERLASPQR